MQTDPVVTKVRKLREVRAARFGFDIRSIVKDAQNRDASGDRIIIHLPPRRPHTPTKSDPKAIDNG